MHKKVRSYVSFYLNGELKKIEGQNAFKMLSDYLRYELALTGTKVVCSEGDCGACTVLVSKFDGNVMGQFKSVNSCITPLFNLDLCHIVSVEGIELDAELHELQKNMVEYQGSQCGYCTPGFICSQLALIEDCHENKKQITKKRTLNYLTGNLCRCTGYEPIIQATQNVDLKKTTSLRERYKIQQNIDVFKKEIEIPIQIEEKELCFYAASELDQALLFKSKKPDSKVVAGNTDLGVWVNKSKYNYKQVLSLQNIPSLKNIEIDHKKNGSYVFVGACVNLDQFEKFIEPYFLEFANLIKIFASPQIKNQATVVGNIVNGSPIGDSIPALMALEAQLEVQSQGSKRMIMLDQFYKGYRTCDLTENEIVTGIYFKLPKIQSLNAITGSNKEEVVQLVKFYKTSVRKDLDISAVTLALNLKVQNNTIKDLIIVVGGVSATVVRLYELEKNYTNQIFSEQSFEQMSKDVIKYIKPLDDLRGSAEFRKILVQNLIKKFYYDHMKTSAEAHI